MINKKFNVEGMSCSACSASVERVVGRIKGVSKASVNLVAKLLLVSFNENLVKDEDIVKAIEKAGFSANVVAEKEIKKYKTQERESQLPSVKFRLIFSAILLLPLMYLSMGRMIGLPIPYFLSKAEHPLTFSLVQLILATPILYVNRKFFYSGVKAVYHRSPNMDTLIMTGSGISYLFSVFSVFMIGFGLETGNVAQIQRYVNNLYFESSAMILLLITIGKGLEEKAKRKTGSAVDGLKKLAPDTATVIKDGKEITLKSSELKVGDVVVIKNGESVPIDGIIVEGNGYFDQSAITGESLPVFKSVGDTVISASINTDGYVLVKATAVGSETTLSKIIDLVRDAGASKAPIAKLADKISGIFVPIIMGISIITLIIWLSLGFSFETAFIRAVSVLVISCPCALGLATPVAVTASIGASAKKGVLIKSAGALELLAKVDTVIFDKTGTLTEGKPTVNGLILAENVTETRLKQIAKTLEEKSSHPLAKSVLSYCNDVDSLPSADYKIVNGKGVECVIDGVACVTGNQNFMQENNVDISELAEKTKVLYEDGNTLLWFAANKKAIGVISVSDNVKTNANTTVQALRDDRLTVTMLSGDNKSVCEKVKNQLQINEAFAGVLPNGKENVVSEIMKSGKTVAFVGDGINDSPALTRANVGIALSDGTAIAIDSADVVLLNGDISKVPTCIKTGKRTLRVIEQNLFWAFFYNIILIPIAAGAFSFLGVTISPMLGALAMSVSSLFVVTNALRLLK